MSNNDDLCSIVIPAYNEERRIKDVVLRCVTKFPGQELIIVCDGEDNSKDIIRDLSDNWRRAEL